MFYGVHVAGLLHKGGAFDPTACPPSQCSLENDHYRTPGGCDAGGLDHPAQGWLIHSPPPLHKSNAHLKLYTRGSKIRNLWGGGVATTLKNKPGWEVNNCLKAVLSLCSDHRESTEDTSHNSYIQIYIKGWIFRSGVRFTTVIHYFPPTILEN